MSVMIVQGTLSQRSVCDSAVLEGLQGCAGKEGPGLSKSGLEQIEKHSSVQGQVPTMYVYSILLKCSFVKDTPSAL